MRRQLQSREGRCFGHTEERWKAQRRFKESPEICGWGGEKCTSGEMLGQFHCKFRKNISEEMARSLDGRMFLCENGEKGHQPQEEHSWKRGQLASCS